MQEGSLTLKIANKNKKGTENHEPIFFSEIPYSNVRQINYLSDLEEKKKNIDFPIIQFEKDFEDEALIGDFYNLPNSLYKRLMQNGNLNENKPQTKRKKKTKNPFEYDYDDVFINDDEAVFVKKNANVKFQNFKCLSSGIEQFYNSELYKSNLSQIQQQSKKRSNEFKMDPEQFEEMRKKIKQNILIAHNRLKEQNEANEAASLVQNLNKGGFQQTQREAMQKESMEKTTLTFKIKAQKMEDEAEKVQSHQQTEKDKQNRQNIQKKSPIQIKFESQLTSYQEEKNGKAKPNLTVPSQKAKIRKLSKSEKTNKTQSVDVDIKNQQNGKKINSEALKDKSQKMSSIVKETSSPEKEDSSSMKGIQYVEPIIEAKSPQLNEHMKFTQKLEPFKGNQQKEYISNQVESFKTDQQNGRVNQTEIEKISMITE